MIKNDIELDAQIKCLEAKMTQQQLGERYYIDVRKKRRKTEYLKMRSFDGRKSLPEMQNTYECPQVYENILPN